MALSGDRLPTGAQLALQLRQLASGAIIETGPQQLEAAFLQLAAAGMIQLRGTLGPLSWNERGEPDAGALEIWCIASGKPAFVSSGLTMDLTTGELRGSLGLCAGEPRTNTPAADGGVAMPEEADAGAPTPPVDTAPTPPSEPGVRAQYRASNRNPMDEVIAPHLLLENRSVQAGLPLAEIHIRYYFTNEGPRDCPAHCMVRVHWTGLHPSGEALDARSRYVDAGGARAYLEVSFPRTAPTLARGESVEVQQELHAEPPNMRFDENNDYSFDASATTYRDSLRITVYRGDQLIWGQPPM